MVYMARLHSPTPLLRVTPPLFSNKLRCELLSKRHGLLILNNISDVSDT
jgi:hypothetical protein